MKKIEAPDKIVKLVKTFYIDEFIQKSLRNKLIPFTEENMYEKFAYIFEIDYEQLMRILDGNINFNFYWLCVIAELMDIRPHQLLNNEYLIINPLPGLHFF